MCVSFLMTLRKQICLNNVDDLPSRGSSFTDPISWLSCEVVKCIIFLLKINTERSIQDTGAEIQLPDHL